MKKSAEPEKLIAIDYGDKNVGLALGFNGIVQPLVVISDKNQEEIINEVAKYIFENKINRIIVGLPVSPDGKETFMSRKVRRFVKFLKFRVKKPVEFENEYRTSEDSITESITLGISKKRREAIDHLSAALILKHYFSRVAG